MNIALLHRPMTRKEFFAWAQAQDGRYEFDGDQPVAMTGGSANHSRICINVQRALENHLLDGPWEMFNGDLGVGTAGNAVRYPDASITCTATPSDDNLIANPVVVFEVLSKTSGRMDRLVKVREYRSVPSIRRYIIVERVSIGLTVFEHAAADEPWTVSVLVEGDTLELPEAGVAIPLSEFYRGIVFAEGEGDD